ncbi:MAG: serine acetyltransferase, partial [Solibacillus isronensis]
MKIEDWLNKETSTIANKLIDYNKKHIEVEKSIGFTGRDQIHHILDSFYEIFFPTIYNQGVVDETRTLMKLNNNLRQSALDLRDIIEK